MNNDDIKAFMSKYGIESMNLDHNPDMIPVHGTSGEVRHVAGRNRNEVTLKMSFDSFCNLLLAAKTLDPGENPAAVDAFEKYLTIRGLTK